MHKLYKKKKKSLLGAITPWDWYPILNVLQFTRGLGHELSEGTVSGAPHGLHAGLVIGFLSDKYVEHSTRVRPVRIKGGDLAVPSQGLKPQQTNPLGFEPLPAPPARISRSSYLSHSHSGDELRGGHILSTI